MTEKNSPQTGASAQKTFFRRRIIVIKRALQMKYVMLVFISVLVTMSIVSLDVYYIVGKLMINELGDANLVPLIKAASRLLAIHLSIYCLLVLLISVFVSHKFAGPIFRLEKIAESIADGHLDVTANFRKGDELFETAETLNRMIESLRQKIQKDKTLSSRVSQKLEELSQKLKKGETGTKEAAAVLEELLVEVKHISSEFKL